MHLIIPILLINDSLVIKIQTAQLLEDITQIDLEFIFDEEYEIKNEEYNKSIFYLIFI